MDKIILGIMAFLGKLFKWDMPSTDNTITEIPITTPEAPKQAQDESSKLDVFCTAIRDFEGRPGDLNYRNNNPGNCRCSPVGYLPKYGNVRCVNNFAVFPTYELGWEYLQNLVLQWASLHPNWTIIDFFTHYAPASDNNPTIAYAKNVAAKCGVSTFTTLRELLG